ncbi:M23 family metallopeptidase [Tessaracoccus antarcticus]|uniref:M23 family metallopeptidase n=1 Tax=Tessaracoccus antarcticus TaxID=2479848 RepID=A0A3M0G928_9ACTN|nr:M23 family metallopeptidase [Tessaracoccus antarcticus]RMB61570.1 M23 family metallopeptidase [Tessaracoccus antarcticus]
MRSLRILGAALVASAVGMLVGVVPQASAASLPTFRMALPVQWGASVQAGGPHTFASGTLSSIDLGAANNASIPVVAAADGVVKVGSANGFSRCFVTVTHADGWQTMYYHLRGVPSDLRDGDHVVAGEKVGMTAMPGSETCGRGTFRHVHLTLQRNGVEQPINGLSLGGYTIHSGSRAYCGHWTRNGDGAVVADARRACLAVPRLVNNIVNPSTLGDREAAPNRGSSRPVIADHDTIPASELYTTPGQHTVGGRAWKTTCEPYSQTQRCRTDIWASQVTGSRGSFALQEGWGFNNLTYVESPRELWADNPLGNKNDVNGGWTAADGRKWRTDCDSGATGRNGCRSYVWVTTTAATAKSSGGYRFTTKNEWVFNNMVRFSA